MICGIGSNSSISEAWCGRGCGWLLIELRDGGTKTAKGHTRRAWSARSLNAAIDAWRLVLAYGCDRRDLAHNVAAPMHKVARVRREMATYTPEEIGLVLRAADKDRNGRLWYLALSGFRRGEIAGLMWSISTSKPARSASSATGFGWAPPAWWKANPRRSPRGARCRWMRVWPVC